MTEQQDTSSSEQPDAEIVDRTFQIKLRGYQSFYHPFLYFFAIASAVLALVCIFAGMLIVEQEPCRTIYIGLCSAWATLLLFGIILDVHGSSGEQRGKEISKRLFCHILSCVTVLYLSTNVFHVASDALPQWLPAIITFAVGISVGARSLSSKEQLWNYFSIIFGCQPVMLASEDR